MPPTIIKSAGARWVFGLRLLSAVASATVFGLIAAGAFAPWSLANAIGLAFLFGTAFVGGTGYRILIATWTRQPIASPASWSGAAASSALASAIMAMLVALAGYNAASVLLAYALAINLAYLAVKVACLAAGCCHAELLWHGRSFGLRQFEASATGCLLLLSASLGVQDAALGALCGIAGHTGLRLFSRSRRGRHASGWPPLRQPGAELAPLYLLITMSIAAVAQLMG